MAVYEVFLALAMATVVSAIDSDWYDAHATCYGDMGGGETMQGACGYGDLFKQGYGLKTAALSTALFNDGLTCGACFEIYCHNDPQWCIPNAGSIKITATNFCPPNYTPNKPDAWCNPPQKHFDLSVKMFTKLAEYRAGIIPVRYRRISCSKHGGIKFEINGNPYFTLVLIYNVGGAGDVNAVKIKGSNTQWIAMSRNWGQNWQTGTVLTGQSLSFQVTVSDGKKVKLNNVAPAGWQFRHTYNGRNNI
ncbi:hypothetical protein EUGRSUZ_F02618 [Eucalyptus grandis]|uniref:Uncharacterized protein n=3 Tax=Eucalyptus grandis TaxID=71139 RepID=A0ACC3KIL0_EUCGR|nr:hypothetical protein EUGRSUZ_F02618 [Eucalyptus grandis]